MPIIDRLFRLDNRIAVVCGGAGRIGRAIAEALTSAGASTVILDLDLEAATTQAETINRRLANEKTAGTCMAYEADSTDPDSLQSAQKRLQADLGDATILFNTTQYRGTGFYGSDPADHPLDAWKKVLDVNLTGVLLACQTFHPGMKKQGGGSIINVSSTYGIVSADPRIYGDSGVNSPVSYAASKSAILNLTRYLAVHWRDHGIRVNCLVPGGVFDNQAEDFVTEYSNRTPLGRMANAEEYQGAALFMASQASSYMTGSILTVDGGWTAW